MSIQYKYWWMLPRIRKSSLVLYICIVLLGLSLLLWSEITTSYQEENAVQELQKDAYFEKKSLLTVGEIKEKVSQINSEHTVHNAELFGPLQKDSVVILIQVHKRLEYLKELVKSLENVRGINSTLLVFSHDYYDEDILDFVKSIKFAKFVIIFFPYAVQIHPDSFPGVTPGDCHWNLSTFEAERIKCNMYEYPDLYGHYRQGHITQIKHHWWWKAINVFDGLDYTKHHNGTFLFLEEDLYVTEDVLHVINLLNGMKSNLCDNCNLFFLGTLSENQPFFQWNANMVQFNNWNSIGFTMNRALWVELKQCADTFCTFDDYNWDWSFRYTAQRCFKHKRYVLALKGARVFHIGACGIHHAGKTGCKVETALRKVTDFLSTVKQNLFPKELVFIDREYRLTHIKKGWGGWADPRDQQLCKFMLRQVNKV